MTRVEVSSGPPHAVAVIGMVGRFPGAADVAALWNNTLAGREGVRFWREDEIDAWVPAPVRQDPRYVRAKGVIEDCDRFDADFFGIGPLEAQVMDPQHRVLLELAWTALEASGHRPGDRDGRTGVFVGANWNRYRQANVASNPSIVADFGELNTALANELDFLATRISHKLGLTGPSVTVSTACSTSLVAIAQAARALAQGECDIALAGGVSISVPLQAGYLHEPGSMLSPDGHCRPFDAAGSGTTFNDGAGVVVLRRLSDALADGDTVHAVILGHAVNNDGADKVSFSAPSVAGQAAVLRDALAHAQVPAETIGYIEAHGTATPMGDPIEFAALVKAYRGRDLMLRACALGSVKSAVGHLVHAAGVVGFIMAATAVSKGVVPPTLFFRSANPRLQLDKSRFYVPAASRAWRETAQPRRAAVSAFGVGGTNAHVILEQAPDTAESVPGACTTRVLCLSARSRAALQRMADRLSAHLLDRPTLSLADVAFTLQAGRAEMRHRAAVVADSLPRAVELLQGEQWIRGEAVAARRCVFVFPGHGAQRSGMGRILHERSAIFRRWCDEGARILVAHGHQDPLPWLLRGEGGDAADLSSSLPALFLFEYALAAVLEQQGIVPDLYFGCSLGEFVAAARAGVIPFADAVLLTAVVAASSSGMARGGMLTAYASASEVASATDGVEIAALLAADITVVAGDDGGVDSAIASLERAGIRTSRLPVGRAFHSAAVDPVVMSLRARLQDVPLEPPRVPILSAAVGRELTEAEALSVDHWSRVLRLAMNVTSVLDEIHATGPALLLEVGPGVGMTALALQHPVGTASRPIAVQPGSGLGNDAWEGVLTAVGQAWCQGAVVRWEQAWHGEARRRVELPTYPFERVRHWLEAGATPPVRTIIAPSPNAAGAPASTASAVSAAAVEDVATRLARVLTAVSGVAIDPNATSSWADAGFDSLTITQLAIAVRREFGVESTFRELMERRTSPAILQQWLRAESLSSSLPMPTPRDAAPPDATVPGAAPASRPEAGESGTKRPNPGARIERSISADHQLGDAQRTWLDRFLAAYAARTPRSKAFAQQHRRHLADPRTVSGFHPILKEIVYPIVTDRSRGSRLWDLDGNEYVDFLNGFGCIFFGHSPEFLTEAVQQQLQSGIEVGPQTPLAGEVAELFCRLTGNERVAFSNTGSEAVAGALRVARTVTGRDTIVMFEGSYHGIFDEVVARAGPRGIALPGSPGVPRHHVADVVMLPYGVDASLREIERLGPQLAAVLIEPVQSRRPDLQPVGFLRELRRLTEASGTAMILDEVVTGFRTHPGGIQALFGIRADMTIYGKVVAGGHPIGLIGGTARYLDALDGGAWQFGDASVPEVGVTFFAGTFVRHPVALAATRAVLKRMLEEGPDLQANLGRRAATLVASIQAFLDRIGARVRMASFQSMMFVSAANEPWSSLLFAGLRQRGMHIWDHFPCFLTTAHSDDDLQRFESAFREVVTDLVAAGFLAGRLPEPGALDASRPPVAGARLGRRSDGSLAWFVADPERPGKYREVSVEGRSR